MIWTEKRKRRGQRGGKRKIKRDRNTEGRRKGREEIKRGKGGVRRGSEGVRERKWRKKMKGRRESKEKKSCGN